jgi:hypothetical protein
MIIINLPRVQIVQAVSAKQFEADPSSGGQALRSVQNVGENESQKALNL